MRLRRDERGRERSGALHAMIGASLSEPVPAPMPLFPHHKLDWNLSRLEKQLEVDPNDAGTLLEYAATALSRAAFHGGGERWFERASQVARQMLQRDPNDARALTVAAAAHIGTAQSAASRLEHAKQLADSALACDPDRPEIHYVLALWYQASARAEGAKDKPKSRPSASHDRARLLGLAIREAEISCRLAQSAWEPHALLAGLLWERTTDLGGPSKAVRSLERSQYHTVRALQLGASPDHEAELLFHLAVTCTSAPSSEETPKASALEAAAKLFARLLDDPKHRERAQYYLGLVNYQMGRYKNAVLYFRQHIDKQPDNPKAHGRISVAYLSLGEISKAKESAARALQLDPQDVSAKLALGSALAADAQEDEAQRVLRSILEVAPDHQGAFAEIVRMREARRDVSWLQGALRAEVKGYDRLPVSIEREHGPMKPRATTSARIAMLAHAICRIDPQTAIPLLLEAMDLTTDEHLRFQLWEIVLDQVSAVRSAELREALKQPGTLFSAKAGREVLAMARSLPTPLLVSALQIDEEDLKRAAVERHGPARDVGAHRRAIDTERREARAWQALVLLAVASNGDPESRALLSRWAAEADPDLADAARAALVMLGDEEAADALMKRARARGAGNLVEAMITQVSAPSGSSPHPVRSLAPGEDRACSACNRRPSEFSHLLVGYRAALCDRCIAEVATRKGEAGESYETDEIESVCMLTGRARFETKVMYQLKGVTFCREVLDQGLGFVEREAVGRYLASL